MLDIPSRASVVKKNSIYSTIGSFIVAAPIAAWWAEYTLITPVPLYHRYGEIVTYFIDSLAVFNGATYSYIDHPGTPVSVIGSILLALTYPFTTGFDFTLYHLSHPLIFVTLTNIFLTLSFIISALYFYRASRLTLTRMPLMASLCISLMYFFLHTQSFDAITLWHHNSFSYPFGMPLLLFLFFMVMDDRRIENRRLLLFGFLAGAFSAVQFFFIVWPICSVITIFIFYRMKKETIRITLKAGFILTVSAIAGFVTAILPVINKMPKFFRWIINMVATNKRYDAGTPQFITWKEFVDGFSRLIDAQPVLFLAAAILIIIFLLLFFLKNSNTSPRFGISALGFGLALQTILLTLMFVRESGSLYGLSIAATLPILALINLKLLEEKLGQQSEKIYGVVVACLLIFAGLATITNLNNSIVNYRDAVRTENKIHAQISSFISDYSKNSGRPEWDLVIVHTADSLDDCAALLFGRSYAHLQIDAELSRLCPNQYYMDYWNKRLLIKEGRYSIDQLDWDLLMILKSNLALELPFLRRREISHEIAPGYIILENNKIR
jgi:hypothetical protein